MRTGRPQPLDLLPRARDGVGGKPAADAPDRRAVPEGPVLRQSTDDGGAPAAGGGGPSQASPAADGRDGPGGAPSQAADDGGRPRCSEVSVLAPRPNPDPG